MKYQTITLGGNEYPVSFGTLPLSLFGQKYGLSVTGTFGLFTPNDPERPDELPVTTGQILDLALFGLKEGDRRSGQDHEWTAEKVADKIDEDGFLNAFSKIVQAFANDNQMPQNGQPVSEKKAKAAAKAKK